jgi:hypothetical protein
VIGERQSTALVPELEEVLAGMRRLRLQTDDTQRRRELLNEFNRLRRDPTWAPGGLPRSIFYSPRLAANQAQLDEQQARMQLQVIKDLRAKCSLWQARVEQSEALRLRPPAAVPRYVKDRTQSG